MPCRVVHGRYTDEAAIKKVLLEIFPMGPVRVLVRTGT